VAIVGLVDQVRTVLSCGAADSERKLATGVLTAVQDIGDSVTGLLARKTGPEDSGDVLVVVEAVNKDRADRVNDNNGVVAQRGDVLDQSLTTLPKSEIVAVTSVAINGDVTFTRIGVDEDDSGVSLASHSLDLSVGIVISNRSNDTAVVSNLALDRLERSDEVREVSGS